MNAATEAKTAVEESQRELRRRREESGQTFVPRFFQQDKDGRWVPKFKCVPVSHTHTSPPVLISFQLRPSVSLPEDPQQAVEAVKAWIWAAPPGQR